MCTLKFLFAIVLHKWKKPCMQNALPFHVEGEGVFLPKRKSLK